MTNEEKIQIAREALGQFLDKREHVDVVLALKWPNGNPMFVVLDEEQEPDEFTARYEIETFDRMWSGGWRKTLEG